MVLGFQIHILIKMPCISLLCTGIIVSKVTKGLLVFSVLHFCAMQQYKMYLVLRKQFSKL